MGQRPIDPSQGPATTAGPQIPGPNVIGPAGPTPRPGCQTPQQQQQQPQPGTKTNRVTSVAKPVGLDPLLILQERENRYRGNLVLRNIRLIILYIYQQSINNNDNKLYLNIY